MGNNRHHSYPCESLACARLAQPMTNCEMSDVKDRTASEDLGFLLSRAGIVLPAERTAEVAAEYESFRQQIALVNGAFTAQDEPALIFVARLKAVRG